MTPQPTAAAHLTLDPATTDATLATIYSALHPDPECTPAQRQTQREAAAALIAALHPRDPTEAADAARAVAAHYGSMECFRRAVLPDAPDSVAIRWYGKTLALSRMNTEMVRTLQQCQAETPHAQPQPSAESTMPAPPRSAVPTRPAAAGTANPSGRQNPMPSENPSPAPAAAPAGTPQPPPRQQTPHATAASAQLPHPAPAPQTAPPPAGKMSSTSGS